ncbi:hypothetical protein [Microbacterium aurantiacum]|uniref:hypothetical protein n=1 Tax=Microbacterium aurantiacum TaxID=162393 RepID=UPI0040365A23
MARARTGAADDDDRSRHEHVVDEEWVSLGVRRAPRVGRFLFIGLFGGLATAIILTIVAGFTAPPGGPLSNGPSGYLRVFGVLAALCIGLGLLVMSVLAIVLDRFVGVRTSPVIAEHATTLHDDLTSPVGDDPPRWVRDAADLAPPLPRPPRAPRPDGPPAGGPAPDAPKG